MDRDRTGKNEKQEMAEKKTDIELKDKLNVIHHFGPLKC